MQDAEDYSWNTFDETIAHLVSVISPATVLDVGAGAGKYADIIRSTGVTTHITAVEIGEDSISRHGLNEKYDDIIRETSDKIIEKYPMARFDLVILGDVIEHLKKSDGIDFLNWLNYRAKYIVIVVPESMVMNRDPWYEGHNSVWTDRDFLWHDNWCSDNIEQAQLFILRGYPEHPVRLANLCQILNDKQIVLTHLDIKRTLNLKHVNTVKFDIHPSPNPDAVIHYRWRHQ